MDPRGVEACLYHRQPDLIESFQMDPRGVEAATSLVAVARWLWFQMDPRGVEAVMSQSSGSVSASFRWTLVGLKLESLNLGCIE